MDFVRNDFVRMGLVRMSVVHYACINTILVCISRRWGPFGGGCTHLGRGDVHQETEGPRGGWI